jgi:hypothetical protein
LPLKSRARSDAKRSQELLATALQRQQWRPGICGGYSLPKAVKRREPMPKERNLAGCAEARLAKDGQSAIQNVLTGQTRDEVRPYGKLNTEIQKKKAGAA